MVDPASLRDRVLVGRYRLDERLGAGGMGSIWRAQHLVLAAPVAVKLIDREALPDEETRARFIREAQSAATLRSPHVVQILDYGVDDTLPFIVMELLDGENLAMRLRRMGRLGPADTARIVTHMGRAVARAHEAGIVHRDLKPENVFLIRNEDEEIAKVLDFGVAKLSVGALGADATRTRTGSILGTPYYMSPEQAQGNKLVDHRSDLWSLGVIAFECLTGQRPFYSDGLGDLVLQICIREIPLPSSVASVPAGFDAWFARAVARDPDARFQSARELTDSLREVLGKDIRDVQGTGNESLAAEERAPNSQSRTLHEAMPPSGLNPRGDSSSRIRPSIGGGGADHNARTFPAPVEAPRFSQPDPPPNSRPNSAVIAELLAHADSEPPRHRSGAFLVFGVAGIALLIGLGAGLIVFTKREHDPRLRPLPSAVPPAHEAELSRVRPKAADRAAAGREEPLPLTSGSGKILSSAARPSASTVPLTAAPLTAVGRPVGGAAVGAPQGVPGPADAGWVKPAWAMPDDEPRHDRGDDSLDAGK